MNFKKIRNWRQVTRFDLLKLAYFLKKRSEIIRKWIDNVFHKKINTHNNIHHVRGS